MFSARVTSSEMSSTAKISAFVDLQCGVLVARVKHTSIERDVSGQLWVKTVVPRTKHHRHVKIVCDPSDEIVSGNKAQQTKQTQERNLSSTRFMR